MAIYPLTSCVTCIAGNPPQDAHQAGQRSASPPAVVRLQHGEVLVLDVRRDDQILQVPLLDFGNFIQAELLQQRVLHILVRKRAAGNQERGAQDAKSAEEIHDETF